MYQHNAIKGSQIKKAAWKTVATAGLVAGVLDGLAACISFYISTGRGPEVVFKFIASGILGKEVAYAGGTPMVLAGILLHMMIATIWAAIFYYVYPLLKDFGKKKVLVGLLYGLIVWLGMNLIVVPLSNTPKNPGTVIGMIKGAAIIMVCVGLPISLIVSREYEKVRGK